MFVTALLASWILSVAIESVSAAVTEAVPGTGGDTWTQMPFGGFGGAPFEPMRMQQVYDAEALAPSLPEGGWISGLWFVSDEEVGRAWGASFARVEILFGITGRGPDELSAVFVENFAVAPTVVRPDGALSITSFGPRSVVEINFVNPYFYDPSAGNLLLEIKNFLPPDAPVPQLAAGPLDAWDVMGDSVSRVWARGDANAAVGTVDTIGLTTRFVVVPVPEPSTVALLALGAGALAWRWLRHRRPGSNC